jgi:hypothetical protein
MFALMAVLWLVLALPTIDQQFWTLFYFVCQYCALSAQQPLNKEEEEASRRRAATHHRHHQASVFQIREDDDTSDGEGEGETATTPRLSGSQELKKSEEGGESVEEEEEEGHEGAASSVETAKSKTKPKKRVRFSD